MPNFLRNKTAAALYLLAFWHAYTLVARPLLGHGAHLPASEAVRHYSGKLLLYPSWSFFYYIPEDNIWVQYMTDKDPETVHSFYGPADSYLQRMRYYRCGACGHASFQLYLRAHEPSGGWLLTSYLCRLEPEAGIITVRLGVAHFRTDLFKPVKETKVSCDSYR